MGKIADLTAPFKPWTDRRLRRSRLFEEAVSGSPMTVQVGEDLILNRGRDLPSQGHMNFFGPNHQDALDPGFRLADDTHLRHWLEVTWGDVWSADVGRRGLVRYIGENHCWLPAMKIKVRWEVQPAKRPQWYRPVEGVWCLDCEARVEVEVPEPPRSLWPHVTHHHMPMP